MTHGSKKVEVTMVSGIEEIVRGKLRGILEIVQIK